MHTQVHIYGRTRVKVYIIEYNNWLYCGLVNFFEIFVSYYLSAECWHADLYQELNGDRSY